MANLTGSSISHNAEAVALGAEKRWAVVVAAIIVLLIAMMVFTGVHWAAMPPSRVETVDLGTAVEADGKVVVRLIAQQYSFTPQCIVVPVNAPVTFRGTSSDAIHGFIIGKTNANVMLVPGFVATFTTSFKTTGEMLMPCHEYCGTGHEGMWARVQVVDQNEFMSRATDKRRLSCVPD